MNIVVLLLDAECRVTFSSHFVPQIDPRDVLGKPVWESSDMDEDSAARCRGTITATRADGKPRNYMGSATGIGTWKNWVYRCLWGDVRIVLIARQMPPMIQLLRPSERDFCREMLMLDAANLAKQYGCSVQAISQRRARIAAKMGVSAATLRVFLASYRHWLE